MVMLTLPADACEEILLNPHSRIKKTSRLIMMIRPQI